MFRLLPGTLSSGLSYPPEPRPRLPDLWRSLYWLRGKAGVRGQCCLAASQSLLEGQVFRPTCSGASISTPLPSVNFPTP